MSETGFTFTGCNTINIPIQLNADSTIQISSQATSTLKVCNVDNDSDYINAITFADGYGIEGNNFYLTTQNFRFIDFIYNQPTNINFINQNQNGIRFPPVVENVRPSPQVIVLNQPSSNIRVESPQVIFGSRPSTIITQPAVPVCNPADAEYNFNFHG